MFPAHDLWYKSLVPLMTDIRRELGSTQPLYLTFDIDAIDPSYCPGTGTRNDRSYNVNRRMMYTIYLLIM